MEQPDFLGLKGKHAIVWGGGFGMGERTSYRLSQVGAHVAVVDLDPARAEKIAGELNALGRTAKSRPCKSKAVF